MFVGRGEEMALAMAWRTTRVRSLGWKGGMIREAPVQGAENGSWEAPKRQSAAWKEENVIGSPCTLGRGTVRGEVKWKVLVS